ncbi:MAG: 50S ribosomal protein L29 [bacterium]
MKTSELRNMTKEELNSKLGEERHALFNLKFQVTIGQVENRLKLRTIRRDIARILTILREKEIKESKHASR